MRSTDDIIGPMPFSAAVDVVIPTYNRAHVISRALDSAMGQTHPVRHVFVVDDGSQDDTAAVVARYGDKVSMVRQKNAGASAARNTGIRLCEAEWVAFLDSDDFWQPTKIQRQMEELARVPGAVLCHTSIREQAMHGSGEGSGQFGDTSVSVLRYNNFIALSSVVARRSVLVELDGFDTTFTGAEDWDLWFRSSRRGALVALNEPLTVIVQTSGSLSGNADEMIENVKRLIDKTLVADLSGWQRWVWRRRILSSEYFHAFITARDRKLKGAREYLLHSLRVWPSPLFIPKRYASLALLCL